MKCNIKAIKVANWDHSMDYTLPVKPSPNLNTQLFFFIHTRKHPGMSEEPLHRGKTCYGVDLRNYDAIASAPARKDSTRLGVRNV